MDQMQMMALGAGFISTARRLNVGHARPGSKADSLKEDYTPSRLSQASEVFRDVRRISNCKHCGHDPESGIKLIFIRDIHCLGERSIDPSNNLIQHHN